MENEISKEMMELIELIKSLFKEKADMEIVSTSFGDASEFVVVKIKDGYKVIIPLEWKTKELKGENLIEIVANIKFCKGYTIEELLS